MLDALEARAKVRGFQALILKTSIDWTDALAFYLQKKYIPNWLAMNWVFDSKSL
jgi:hypothetical protein